MEPELSAEYVLDLHFFMVISTQTIVASPFNFEIVTTDLRLFTYSCIRLPPGIRIPSPMWCLIWCLAAFVHPAAAAPTSRSQQEIP